MPIYEYTASSPAQSCEHCVHGFEEVRKISDPPLRACPKCGAPASRVYSPPAIREGQSGFDDRAKTAGFHKLQRVGKGEYEKKY